jgi:4-amino-4-deoxy-L-arabinose transferase-like glycosyltransferase
MATRNSLLLALALAAIALRLIGIDSGLPHHCEPDVLLVPHAAWLDRPASVHESGPLWGSSRFYPQFLPWLIAILPGESFITILDPSAGLDAHLASLGDPYLKARIVIALLSVLAIPSAFFLARRIAGERWAWSASLLTATSLLLTNYSQQARPHAALAGLFALALVSVLRLEDRRRLRDHALAGLACGAAAATLHTGAFAALAYVVFLLADRLRQWRAGLLGLGIVLLCVLASYWNILVAGLAPGEQGGVSLGGQDISLALFTGRGFADMARNLLGYEPVLCMLVAGGALLWAIRPTRLSRASLVLLGAGLPFVLLFGLRNVAESRFFVALIPLLSVWAAWFFAAWERQCRLGAKTALPLSILCLLPGLDVCARLVWLRSRGDSLEHAARWLEQHADRERDVIGVQPSFALPLFNRRENLERMHPRFRHIWDHYQLALAAQAPHPWDLRTIAREEWWRTSPAEEVARFAREEALTLGLGVVPTARARGHNQVLEGLRQVGEPVWREFPFPEAQAQVSASAWEFGSQAWLKVWTSESWGHPVEIVRLR